MVSVSKLKELVNKLKDIQQRFYSTFGVKNIYSNSKIYEMQIADCLGHTLIAKHSGARDATDNQKNEYEYKHYKETSCNHTWTFNDFSYNTIKDLLLVKAVVFAHIDDTKENPVFDWCYFIRGKEVSNYLAEATKKITNSRKMINVGPTQIEKYMNGKRLNMKASGKGLYVNFLDEIYKVAKEIEKCVETKNILTSNKIWEVIIGAELGHKVITEQTKYDATDNQGNLYEYKVSQSRSFNFEDISENVLNKFEKTKAIYLAVVDKDELKIEEMYEAEPAKVVNRLRKKLAEKSIRFKEKGKEIRRFQVSLSAGDLKIIGAKKII